MEEEETENEQCKEKEGNWIFPFEGNHKAGKIVGKTFRWYSYIFVGRHIPFHQTERGHIFNTPEAFGFKIELCN